MILSLGSPVLLLASLPPLRLPPLDGRWWVTIGSRKCLKTVQIMIVVCLLGSEVNSCLGIGGCRSTVTWQCCLSVHNNMLGTFQNLTSVPTPSLWCFAQVLTVMLRFSMIFGCLVSSNVGNKIKVPSLRSPCAAFCRPSLRWGFLPSLGIGGRQLGPGCASKTM
jgi:hypothetical protein